VPGLFADEQLAAYVAQMPPPLSRRNSGSWPTRPPSRATAPAAPCLRLRDEHPAALPGLQVLLYANTDLTGAQPSMRKMASGWGRGRFRR
jgi:hypothetical protein